EKVKPPGPFGNDDHSVERELAQPLVVPLQLTNQFIQGLRTPVVLHQERPKLRRPHAKYRVGNRRVRPAEIRKLPVGEKVSNVCPAGFDGNPNLIDPQHMLSLPWNLTADRNLDSLFL